jgi:hypothetical protein
VLDQPSTALLTVILVLVSWVGAGQMVGHDVVVNVIDGEYGFTLVLLPTAQFARTCHS